MLNRRRRSTLARALRTPHRFHPRRRLTLTVTLLGLAAVPLTNLAQIDLWGGNHYAFTRPSGLVGAIIATAMALASFYMATFLVNFAGGRFFCGWGCPGGASFMLADEAEVGRHTTRRLIKLVGFVGVLGLLGGLWLVDESVLWAGSVQGLGLYALVSLGIGGALFVHAKYWRWGFCRAACPVGLYYSIIQFVGSAHGVHFRDDGSCKDCKACEVICPVELDPKVLRAHIRRDEGLAFDDVVADSLCLRCGLCVEACESVAGPPAPLGFGRLPQGNVCPNANQKGVTCE